MRVDYFSQLFFGFFGAEGSLQNAQLALGLA